VIVTFALSKRSLFMKTKSLFLSPCLACAAILLAALHPLSGLAEIRGPVLGYIFDRAIRGLRPIWGTPGSSQMGEVVNLGKELVHAQPSPTQEYVLAVAVTAELLLVDLRNGIGALSIRPLDGLGDGTPQFAFSSQGRAAALLLADRNSLTILTGLPDSPTVGGRVDLTSTGATPERMALSDDGSLVVLSVPEGETSRLYAYTQAAGLQAVGLVGRVAALRILANGQDVVVADSSTNEVFLIRGLQGAAHQVLLASQQDGIANPVALAISRDSQQLFVANAGTGTVAAFSLEGGAPVVTPCDCIPATLEPLEGNSVFRLTELSNTPLLMLEASPAGNRVLFVPQPTSQRSLTLPERRQSRSLRIRRPSNH
jgi:hypothetical protein